MIYRVWYTIPTANKKRVEKCFEAWKTQGFSTAAFLDLGADSTKNTDLFVNSISYPGYFASVNHLVSIIKDRADIIVTGGDDIYPDSRFKASELADQFLDRFPDGFGVMQPTGDPMQGTAEICGSPWFGHGWINRSYMGNGPFFSDYFAFFGDEELKIVSKNLGVLWQRPDLIQRHDHWTRPGGPPMEPYQKSNQKYWYRDQKLFEQRKLSHWPGSGARP